MATPKRKIETTRAAPKPRRGSEPRTGFAADTIKLIESRRATEIADPVLDPWRFANRRPEPTTEEAIDREIERLSASKGAYDTTAGLFGDQASVDLYRDLLAYRGLGATRYELPLSTPRYIEMFEEAGALLVEPTKRPSRFPFGVYRLEFLGEKIEVEAWLGNVVFSYFLKQYYLERPQHVVRPEKGEVVIDAGACFGDTAIGFAAAVGPNGRVISLEPTPDNLSVVRSNIERNPTLAPRIQIVERALTDQSDQILRFNAHNASSRIKEDGNLEVKSISIDDLMIRENLSKIDFIKMDIEGSEQAALRGAARTIREHKPKLAISAYHSARDMLQIPQLIKSLNEDYEIYLDHYTNFKEETVVYAI